MAEKWVPLVEEFVSVTGASKERAGSLLDACNGNLGMAIEMHFDSCSETTSVARSSASASANEIIDNDADDDVRAPIPQTRGVLVEEPYHTFITRKRTAHSVFDAFRDFQAEAKQQEAVGTSSSLKRKTLQDLFRPPIDLLHKGTFETAKLDGQQHGKWLLVNVQDVKEFACQQLNRDVWSNDAVRTIVKEHFVLWQVYKDSGEGERFIHFYHIESFPSLTVLDPRTGEKLVDWNAATSPQAFCECATEFILLHPSFVGDTPPSKKRKRESIVDASEDSQLQAAIAASLTYTESEKDCKSSSDEEGNGDDDMGFSDSSSEGQPSPKKTSTMHRSKVRETISGKEETNTRTSKGTIHKLAFQTDATSTKRSNVPSSDNTGSTKEVEVQSVGETSVKTSSKDKEIHKAGTSKASNKNEEIRKAGTSKASSKSEEIHKAGTSKASSKNEEIHKAGTSKASSKSEEIHKAGTSKASNKNEEIHKAGTSKASSKSEEIHKAGTSKASSKSEEIHKAGTSKASSKSEEIHKAGTSKASSKSEEIHKAGTSKASSKSEEIHKAGTSKASSKSEEIHKAGTSKASSKSEEIHKAGTSKASSKSEEIHKAGTSKASSKSEEIHKAGTSKASNKNEVTNKAGASKASIEIEETRKEGTSKAGSKSKGNHKTGTSKGSSKNKETCNTGTSKAGSKSKGDHKAGTSKASSMSEEDHEQNSVGDAETKEDNTDSDKNGTDGERPQEQLTGDLCKIMVRFPNGTRKAVSLSAETTLMALVNFVENQGYPNERFELVTNFPRRKLSYLDFKTTLRAAGLYPQEAVFVQER